MFSEWKLGEEKDLFIGFAFGRGPKEPVMLGRSELFQIKLFDSE